MRLMAVIGVLAFAGCQTGKPAPLAPVGEALVAADRAACEKQGGRFGPLGSKGDLTCFTTPRDAGKQCSSAAQCDSACLARSGTCSPIKPLNGCNEIFNSAGVRLMQCIE